MKAVVASLLILASVLAYFTLILIGARSIGRLDLPPVSGRTGFLSEGERSVVSTMAKQSLRPRATVH